MPAVRVDKSVFTFQGHGHGIASSDTLRIQNVTEGAVTFKVKTNNCRRYAVRPNLAVIAGGAIADITIVHNSKHPIPVGPAADKFLLEVAPVPDAPQGSPAFSATHFWEARKHHIKANSRKAEDIAAAAVAVDSYHFRVAFVGSGKYTDPGAAEVGTDDSTALSSFSTSSEHMRAMRNKTHSRSRTPSCAPQSRASNVAQYSRHTSVKTARSRVRVKSDHAMEVIPEEVPLRDEVVEEGIELDEIVDDVRTDQSTGSSPTPEIGNADDGPVFIDTPDKKSAPEGIAFVPPEKEESKKDTGLVAPVPSPEETEQVESDPPAQAIVEMGSGKKTQDDESLELPVESVKKLGGNVTIHKLGPDVTVEEAAEAIKNIQAEGASETQYIILQSKKAADVASARQESDKQATTKKESAKASAKASEKASAKEGETKVEDPALEPESAPQVTVIAKKESSGKGSSGKAVISPSKEGESLDGTVPSPGNLSEHSDSSRASHGKSSASKESTEKRSDSKRTGSSSSEDEGEGEKRGIFGRMKDKMRRAKEKVKDKLKGSDSDSSSDEEKEGGARGSEKSDEVDETLRKVAQVLAGSSGADEDTDGKRDSSSSSSSSDEETRRILVTAVENKKAKDSTSSFSGPLYHGELAPTPPNERATPAEFSSTRYGTEPSQRSISDLSREDDDDRGTVSGHSRDERSLGDFSGTLSTAPSARQSEGRTYMGDSFANDSRSDSSFMQSGRRDRDNFGRRGDPFDIGSRRPPMHPRPHMLSAFGRAEHHPERNFMGIPPPPLGAGAFDPEFRDVRDDFPDGDYRPAPSTSMKTYTAVQFADSAQPHHPYPAMGHHDKHLHSMDTPYSRMGDFDDDELTMYQPPRPRRRRRRRKKAELPLPPEQSPDSSSEEDRPKAARKKVAGRRGTPLPSPSNSPPESALERATLIATVPGAKSNKEAAETVEKALGKIKMSVGGESDHGSDMSVVGSGSDERAGRARTVITAGGKKVTLTAISPVHSENEGEARIRDLNAKLDEASANLEKVRKELADEAKRNKKARRKSRIEDVLL